MDVSNLHLRAGVEYEPFLLRRAAGLGEGIVYAIGPGGDKNPSFVLDEVWVRNTGSKDIYVGKGLVGAVAGSDEQILVAAGKDELLRGPFASLALYNLNGSGGAGAFNLDAKKLHVANHSRAGGHPGHGEIFGRLVGVGNAAVPIALKSPAKIRVTGVRTWSKVVPSSAAGTFLGTVSGRGNNLLSATNINLKALTTVTLQTQALTATTASLDLEPDEDIVITGTSNNVDLVPGDVLFSILYDLR